VSRHGHGIPGVPVRLLGRANKLSLDQWEGEAVTDAKGAYRVDHVEPGRRCWVFVPIGASQALGAFRAESLLAGRDGSVTTAPELRCGEGRTLSGRVSYPVGVRAAPAESCRVRLVRMIDDPGSLSLDGRDVVFARVDEEGRFSFHHVPEEPLWIRAESRGFRMSDSLAAPLRRYWLGAGRLDAAHDDEHELVLPMVVQRPHGEPTLEELRSQ
jgi:hypothetical protein